MLQEFGSAKNQNIQIYENRRFQNVALFNTGVGPQQFVTKRPTSLKTVDCTVIS